MVRAYETLGRSEELAAPNQNQEDLHIFSPINLAAALIALNLVTFAMFGIDKAKAQSGTWRVKESTLLTLALLGGTLGAYAGRALFRHKTRKQPFGANLFAIAVLQVLSLGALIGWLLSGRPAP